LMQSLTAERHKILRDFFSGILICSLTFLAAACIPFLGYFILILSPLPILYYYSKNGRVHGSAVFIVSFFGVAVFLNSYDPAADVYLLFISGFLGMIVSEVLKKKYSIETTICMPVAMLLIIWSGLVLYRSFVVGISPQTLIESYISGNIQDNIKFYETLDVPKETLDVIKENKKQISEFFMNIFPSVALIGSTFAVWITILCGREIFKKKGLWYPDLGDLSCWKAPEKLVWFLITAGGFLIVPVTWIKIAGLNILIICLFIYLLQGLSITSFFFTRKNVPKVFRVIFYLLVFVQQYFTLLIIAFGLFDLWIDFRKRISPLGD
jgi:uncharacterized protein YybS (DUF2232 family)